MKKPQADRKDHAEKENVVDAETIRQLEELAGTIDVRIKQIDEAAIVTQDTLQLEFRV